ncbi:hypothetical protein [Pseudanabaena sp. PCC 6802]|uniref:hypothetical protein n=1 Tax=Pseudanabaena sp. PCC 6802 TaxID=118173 RepID=UPI00034A61F5|nr:hypothetical protein [Pseudanabaena sp. PCC 6802]
MNKLVQKVAAVGLVSGSCLLAINARPASANPAERPVYERTETPYVRTRVYETPVRVYETPVRTHVYEARPVSYLPSYIRTSEYCETNQTRFSGVWTRRGVSPTYDVVWTDYNGERIYGTAEVVENNNGYLTLNYRAGHNSGYYQVRYDTRDSISGTWRDVSGRLWGSVTAYVQL